MKEYFARLLLVSVMLIAGLSIGSSTTATAADQCPSIEGEQTVDICVPPSKPRAWITTICVKGGEGTARVRLKNNGKVWTETFWIRGAGADRVVKVKPRNAKTIRVKRLKVGKQLRVSTHGLVYDRAVVVERNCR